MRIALLVTPFSEENFQLAAQIGLSPRTEGNPA